MNKRPNPLTPSHLAFIQISKEGLDFWENVKNSFWERAKSGLYSDEPKPIETTFVSIGTLEEKARQPDLLKFYTDNYTPLIWQGTVGFMSKSWIHSKARKQRSYKFSTGLYCVAGKLMLVDDIFEWTQGRLKSNEVRTAWDIIKEIRKNK